MSTLPTGLWLFDLFFLLLGIFWIKELIKPTMKINGFTYRMWTAMFFGFWLVFYIVKFISGLFN